MEDTTEEAVLTRHEKCEHDEKKKFLSYLKLPLGYGRSRSHKRTDSRAESSGANTPDPLSPHAADNINSESSPLTSPPSTPMAPVLTEEPLPSVSVLRKRTISQSRWVKEREESWCNAPEQTEVPPYDKRAFPLSNEEYEKMLKVRVLVDVSFFFSERCSFVAAYARESSVDYKCEGARQQSVELSGGQDGFWRQRIY